MIRYVNSFSWPLTTLANILFRLLASTHTHWLLYSTFRSISTASPLNCKWRFEPHSHQSILLHNLFSFYLNICTRQQQFAYSYLTFRWLIIICIFGTPVKRLFNRCSFFFTWFFQLFFFVQILNAEFNDKII